MISMPILDHVKDDERKEILNLPLILNEEDDFVTFVSSRLTNYLQLLRQYQKECDVTSQFNKIETLVDGLCEVIKLLGNSYEAYERLSVILHEVGFNEEYMTKYFACDVQKDDVFYRIRNVDTDYPLEMFHCPKEIPSSQRERFEVINYPHLYLGNTEEVCKLEVGISNECTLARYISKSNFKLFDLTLLDLNNLHVNEPLGTSDAALKELMRESHFIWPLIAVSYVCVNVKDQDDDKVKMSYVFSQMIAHYIRTHCKDIDGIRYFTVRYPLLNPTESTHVNYALFTNEPYNKASEEGKWSYDMDLYDKFTIEIVNN